MERGDLTAVYCIGENPVQSEADQKRAIRLLEGLDMLVVQDLFLTKTAELADVVLPAIGGLGRERGHRHELRATRPAGARRRGRHPTEPATTSPSSSSWRTGWAPTGASRSPRRVWDEVRALSPVHAGMCYRRLEELGGLQWPCYDENHPGELFLHSRLWEDPVPGNRVPFVPVDHDPPVDKLTDEYPIRLTTGRRLDSYNTGVQTAGYTSPLRRGESLDISPGGRGGVRAGRRRARARQSRDAARSRCPSASTRRCGRA